MSTTYHCGELTLGQSIRTFSWDHALFQVSREIRIEIFIKEQGFDLKDEFDEIDKYAIHVLFSLSNASIKEEKEEFVGVLRYDPRKGKIGRIGLLNKYRGLGMGRKMMELFESYLVQVPTPLELRLHSQIQAVGFYSKLGYRPVGNTFIEDGAPHQLMVKEITKK